jgi:glycosyltransferase involved in cell wall biosynthesis
MKVVFVTFGTENYNDAVIRICKQAVDMNVFDTVYKFNEKDLGEDFYKLHGNFVDNNKKGYGHWIWKGYIVNKVMNSIEMGDIIFYADSGCELNISGKERFMEYIELVKSYDSLGFQMEHLERRYTKGDVFKHLDAYHLKDTGQLLGGIFFLKKTIANINFIEKLIGLYSVNDYMLISDKLSIEPNDIEFIDHRQDQSIFSLLYKKHNMYYIKDETYFAPNWEQGYFFPVWATRNNSINSINISCKNYFEGIDHVAWINLDRMPHRKQHMINIFNSINYHTNTRINAVDGYVNDLTKICMKTGKMTNTEIACLLSHLNALSVLRDTPGEYFMVCEDDISLVNCKLMDITVKDIIFNAPEFDVLLLYKSSLDMFTDMYTPWNNDIWGAVAYIITKKAIIKLLDMDYTNITLDVSDKFIYRHLNTIVYKYNYISTLDEDSSIHPGHLDFHRHAAIVQNEFIRKKFLKHTIKIGYTDFWLETKGSLIDYDDINNKTKWNNILQSRELIQLNRGIGLFHINKIRKDFPDYEFIVTDIKDCNLIICSVFGNNKNLYPDKKKIILNFEYHSGNHFMEHQHDYYLGSYAASNYSNCYNMGLYFLYKGFPLYRELMQPRNLQSKKKFCLCIISNERASFRKDFIQKLMEYKTVDCYGKLFKNISNDIIETTSWYNPKILDIIKDYKFMICMENSQIPNYWTEKIINGFLGNTIPIYWGDPNIETVFNPMSFININRLGVDIGVEMIKYLDNNLDAYYSMLSRIPITNNIHDKYYHESYYTDYINNIFNSIKPNIIPKKVENNLVSVIIPTYNRYQFLLNAIKSLKEQTYKNIEIIVINDCSTEKEYYDNSNNNILNNVYMIHLEENSRKKLGYPCAGYVRNMGIKRAKGKYVAFLDDDDIWLPNKLELQIKMMNSTNCKMSCTDGLIGSGVYDISNSYKKYNAENFYDTLQNIYRYRGSSLLDNGFPDIWDLNFLKIHNCCITSSVVIERFVLDKINNMKELTNGNEDYDCWLRVLEHTKCAYVKDICFYYDGGHGYGQNY